MKTARHPGRRRRQSPQRDRAQRTNRSGHDRAGAPSGAFGRPMRRMSNAVAAGERLERELADADNPTDRQRASAALFGQIKKVERLNNVLNR